MVISRRMATFPIALAFIALILIARAFSQEFADDTHTRIEGEDLNKLKTAFSRVLFDPYTAKVSSLQYRSDNKIVCGFVNAKNRFGAYVGSKAFYYDTSDGDLTILDAEPGAVYDFYEVVFQTFGCPTTP